MRRIGPEEAYAGIACRPGQPDVPAYWWEGLAAERDVQKLLTLPILVIRPAPRRWYWREVGAGRIAAWEGCHAALLGVGSLPGRPLVSIYSKEKIVEALELIGADPDNPGHLAPDQKMDKTAAEWLEQAVLPVSMGWKTPYYIR